MDINVNKWLKKLFCGSLIVFALVVGSKIICRKISKKGDKLFYICLSKDFETVKKYKVGSYRVQWVSILLLSHGLVSKQLLIVNFTASPGLLMMF